MAIREVKGRKRPFVVYWDNPFTKRRESKACATRQEAEKLDCATPDSIGYEGNRDITGLMGIFRWQLP